MVAAWPILLVLVLAQVSGDRVFSAKGAMALKMADVERAVQTVQQRGLPAIRGSQRLRVSFPAAHSVRTASAAAPALLLRSRRTGADEVPRLRFLDMAPGQLLVLGLDSAGALRHWSVIADPRIVRAEFPDAAGRLSGRTVPQPRAELLLDLPNDPAIREVRIFTRDAASPGELRVAGALALAVRR